MKRFYQDHSALSSDIDSASDYDQLEISMSISDSFESIKELYDFWNNFNVGEKVAKSDSDEKDADKVFLTSIHKTKGNEYQNVAYFNIVRSITDRATETEMEEERRVAYVGVTRLRKALLVTSANEELSPL